MNKPLGASAPEQMGPGDAVSATRWAWMLAPALMAGMIGQSLSFSVPVPLMPAIAADHGAIGLTIAQLVMALPPLGLMAAGLVTGWLIERAGARNVLIASILGYIAIGALPALIGGWPVLVGSRLILGIVCGIATIAATLLVVSCYDGEARSRMLGYQVSAGSSTSVVALIASGAIMSSFGWPAAFLLYPVPMALLLLCAMWGVPDVRPPTVRETGGFKTASALLWPIYLAACLLFMVPVMVGVQMPFVLTDNGTNGPIQQSIVIGMATVGSASSAAFFGRLQTAIGPRRCFSLALVAATAGYILIGFGRTPVTAAAGALFSGLGTGLFMPYLWLAAATLAPPEIRSRALALLSTAMFFGGFLCPMLVALLAVEIGNAGVFQIVAAALGLATLAALVTPRGRILMS